MGLAKGAAVAFALWFSHAQGVLAQGGPVPDNVSTGLPCMAVNPTYPSAVTSKKVEDTVLLTVRISKSGVVHDIKVVNASPTLAAAAIKAVKRWKYEPAWFVTGPPSERKTYLSVRLYCGREGRSRSGPICRPTLIFMREADEISSRRTIEQRDRSRLESRMIPDRSELTCWNYRRRSGQRERISSLPARKAIKFAVKEAQGSKDVDFILNVIALRAEPLRLEAVLEQLCYGPIAEARNFQFEKTIPNNKETMRIEFMAPEQLKRPTDSRGDVQKGIHARAY